MRGLYERGFAAEDVRQLMRMIDWLMELPLAQERDFRRELDEFEESRHMPYYTGLERLEMSKLLTAQLRAKFGDAANKLASQIDKLYDGEKYLALAPSSRPPRRWTRSARLTRTWRSRRGSRAGRRSAAAPGREGVGGSV